MWDKVELTQEKIDRALKEMNKKPGKPIIILSKFWMKFVAGVLNVPYSSEIDT
ncbi:unnamed protein product, partial [marine sediment metagenome]